MAEIAGRRALRIAQAGFRRDARALFKSTAGRASAVLVRAAANDGQIDRRQETALVKEAGEIVQRLFVAADGRTSMDAEGRPVSPYARALLWWIGWATREAARRHEQFMIDRLPAGVERWLKLARKKPVQEQRLNAEAQRGRDAEGRLIGEMNTLSPSPPPNPLSAQRGGGIETLPWPLPKHGERLIGEQTDEEIAQFLATYGDLRIFGPNPLAQVDPLRQWVPFTRWTDPNGYQLSDRIWQTALRTRMKVDALIADALRTGQGALELARVLEQFLTPGRAALRTQKPYGIDASADAMRLARTEIARAHNQAAWLSAYLNPYVDKIDVSRSPWGDPTCPICPQHATIGLSGERLRPPYPVESADVPPWHPHDMCFVISVVTDDPAAVTARLHAAMEEARELHLEPFMTPTAGDAYVEMLLGEAVWGLLRQIAPAQLALI